MEFRNNSTLTRASYSAPSAGYKGEMYYRDGIPDHSHEYHPQAGSITYGQVHFD